MPVLSLRIAETPEDRERCFRLRREVFVDEQGIPEADEFDALDASAVHVLGTVDSEPVCCGRVVERGTVARIGRVAVIHSRRSAGYGRDLMLYVHAWAEPRFSGAELNAQCAVAGFYRGLGYREVGGTFDECGIPHIQMRREFEKAPPVPEKAACPLCGAMTAPVSPAQSTITCHRCGYALPVRRTRLV